MVNSKKRIIVMLCFLAFLFIFVIGISYAYYVTEVKGNSSNNPSLKFTSGYLSIGYEGGSSSITGGSTNGTTTDLVYTKNFTVTNDGVADSNFGIWIKNYSVKDANGLESPLTRPEDWTYVLSSGDIIIKSGKFPKEDEALMSVFPLNMGETISLTLTLTYNYITFEEGGTDQTADMGKILSFDIVVTQAIDNLNNTSEGTLLYAINNAYQLSIIRNESDLITTPGKQISLENEKIIATTEDDYGTSYYYRGNVENNYVNYSGMCWRIVRVLGDGNIKLVLADENGECDTTNYLKNNTTSSFINNNLKYKYSESLTSDGVAYSNSIVFNELTNWMNKEIKNSNGIVEREKNLDTSKTLLTNWCNDTSISSISNYGYDENNNYTTDELKANKWYTDYNYGAMKRLGDITNANPSLKCNMIGVNNTKTTIFESNIGLLSADEIAFAGNIAFGVNSNNYLYINANDEYWTSTPDSFNGQERRPFIWSYNFEEGLVSGNANVARSIRPAIVLKKDVMINEKLDETINGNFGTFTNPYVIK